MFGNYANKMPPTPNLAPVLTGPASPGKSLAHLVAGPYSQLVSASWR
jgi:hypothetical protein